MSCSPRGRSRTSRPWCVVAPAAALAIVGWIAVVDDAPRVPSAASPVFQSAEEQPPQAALAGVWWRYEAGTTGDPLRFYYFHGDGTGLYRYGQVGASYTHSFDYRVDGDQLQLRIRKTGVEHDVEFSLALADGNWLDGNRADGNGRDWLALRGDPWESETTRYFRLAGRRGPGLAEPAEPMAARPLAAHEDGPPPAGHMWIDLQRYATGGQGFYFYQLRPAGIDGRGVGWFHRGDFDEWSTEALTYRIVDDPLRLELHFEVAGTTQATPIELAEGGERRQLTLRADPRDFGQRHVYLDAGRSFGAAQTSAAQAVDGVIDPRFEVVVARP